MLLKKIYLFILIGHALSGQRNNSLTWAQKTATWANYTTDTNFWTNGCGNPCYPFPYGGGVYYYHFFFR
jgi:hypothetical protein